MLEVEAKVHLSKSDYNRLKKEVARFATLKSKQTKKDTYYAYTPYTPFAVRIREKGSKAIFGIKKKLMINGIEQNQEIEMLVKSKTAFEKILKKVSFPKSFQKNKKSEVYLYKSYQIELNYVPGLGHYLEIEHKAGTEADIPMATKELHAMFKRLGFKPQQFETRFYLEMLHEKGLI